MILVARWPIVQDSGQSSASAAGRCSGGGPRPVHPGKGLPRGVKRCREALRGTDISEVVLGNRILSATCAPCVGLPAWLRGTLNSGFEAIIHNSACVEIRLMTYGDAGRYSVPIQYNNSAYYASQPANQPRWITFYLCGVTDSFSSSRHSFSGTRPSTQWRSCRRPVGSIMGYPCHACSV